MINRNTKIASLILLLGGMTYCTPKQTTKTTEVSTTASELAKGNEIMVTSCGKCHELYKPSTRTMAQWDRILKAMIPKAKLNEEEGRLVRNYIMMNAIDGKK